MSNLLDALKISRALLNDDDGLTWGDALLIPKVGQAWGELLAKYQLNGLDIVKEASAAILVTAGSTTLTLPTDFQLPIKLEEYGTTETVDHAIPLTKTDFIPDLQRESTLRYWAMVGSSIALLGATQDRNVLLYYIRSLAAPKRLADTLAIDQAEIFLGPRIASLCFSSTGKTDQAQSADAMAAANMSMLVRARVKPMQSLPVRRRPFSYRARRGQRVV